MRADLRAGLLLAALAVLVWLPAVGHGWIWDDDFHVTRNPVLTEPGGLLRIWTDPSATPQYYPLTHTSFWIEARLWGLRPAGYHAVNVLLHAAAAVLLWRVLAALALPGAWWAAALFAVHPLQAETVAWVTERKNLLSLVLALGAARAWLADRRPWAAALYAGALLSKTVSAVLPVGLAVADLLRGRRPAWGWLGAMLGAGAALGTLTAWLERTQIGAVGADWDLTLPERALLACRVLLFYLGKLAWPADLSFVYPRWGIDAGDPRAWAAPVIVAALALAAVALARRGRPGPLAALAVYAAALGPALGFVNVWPMRYSWVADHFAYHASIAAFALAGAGLARLPGRARFPVGAALVVLLSALSLQRLPAFAGEEALWRDTLERNPGAWIAHNNLGALLAERGDTPAAERHFRQALALRPGHAGALANLGHLQARSGRPAEAADTFRRALALEPKPETREGLLRALLAAGAEHARAGRTPEADTALREAVALAPEDPEARYDLGTWLARSGRPVEGLPHLEEAVRLRPDWPEAVRNRDLARRLVAREGDLGYPPGP